MKHTLLILITFLFFGNLYSQEYEKIVDTTKMWVVWDGPAMGIPDSLGSTTAYRFHDSTLLEDGKYWYNVLEAKGPEYENWSLNGYIYEQNKLVLYKKLRWTRPADTLYNFNITKGDTLKTSCSYSYIIVQDTSTEVFAGKNRHLQILQGYAMPYGDKIYEGVGSTQGVLSPFYYTTTGAYRKLLCYFKNGELLYHDSNLGNCNYIEDAVYNKPQTSINIYYNSGNIIADIGGYTQAEIKLYNLQGVLVAQKQLKAGVTNIPVESKNSVLLYTITQNKRIIKKGKLIKF